MLKLDDLQAQVLIGNTSRYPRWAVAYKFPPQTAESHVRGFTCQVGRTGRVTPVAEIDPVRLGGAVIRKVSLHNPRTLAALRLRLRDRVTVERRGDVIPQISKPISDPSTAELTTPMEPGKIEEIEEENDFLTCPLICPCELKTPLIHTGALLFCDSVLCPAQRSGSISHFASKTGLNIRGLGPSSVQRLQKYTLSHT